MYIAREDPRRCAWGPKEEPHTRGHTCDGAPGARPLGTSDEHCCTFGHVEATADAVAISNLIAKYAELVDTGDLAGVGELFADAVFIGSGAPVQGRDAGVEKMLRDNMILYEDGTPRTHHVTTNTAVDVDEDTGTAAARS
ncbi:nuclear transport factor 2 family protein [Streptomyces sp. NPDC026673]|uniref:nuclear transport factor 2 family protein n=1 Tax=Streptomyces sp. NPDC026673 TaxID=3155724 RepID=UPI00340B0EA9